MRSIKYSIPLPYDIITNVTIYYKIRLSTHNIVTNMIVYSCKTPGAGSAAGPPGAWGGGAPWRSCPWGPHSNSNQKRNNNEYVCVCIYIFTERERFTCISFYMHYIYIYIERERDR